MESTTTPSLQNQTISNESNNSNTLAGENADGFDKDDDDLDDFGHNQQQPQNNDENEDDGFGDDFDDFEEGGADQGEGDDDDFGDFDDGFQQPEEAPAVAAAAPLPQPVSQPLAHLPNLSFADLKTSDDILNAMSPYMTELFPELVNQDSSNDASTTTLPNDPILTDRSASLWSQLVAPPPLQPPNWIRSRIRRLFLVSLGVPVDLDEILPASKQKKLVLPNIHLPQQDPSTKEKKPESTSRKGPAPPPEFDANEATMLAKTTETAVEGYSDEELKSHVQRLEELIKDASTVLEYWVKRKEDAVGDKEAFEGVIENLVSFAKNNRR